MQCSRQLMRIPFIAASVMCVTVGSADAGVVNLTITGSTADYEIFQPGGIGQSPLPASGSANDLTVDAEDVGAPGDPFNRSNIIYQFDISAISLGIATADFSSVMKMKFAGIPNRDVDLYGSTLNRTSSLLFTDPLAGAEMDGPSYVKLNPGGTPYVDNVTSVNGTRYFEDITAFLQARYADYAGDNSKRWVYFRLQIAPSLTGSNAFYDFYSADAGAEFAPRLDITYVPAPGALAMLGVAAIAGARRRRRPTHR